VESAVSGVAGDVSRWALGIPADVRPAAELNGDRYLGFIFAAAATPHEVEQALTAARDQLRVAIR
jgi:hypothetical protein